MKVVHTPFEGLLVVEPSVYKDTRGYFVEAYSRNAFREAGIDVDFVQDNQSFSVKHVIRGLHFQKPPFAQIKLIRTLSGRIRDVALDLRPGSPTFRQIFSLELSAENQKQILIPEGFAHGFEALSDALVFYKISKYYNRESEGGINPCDPELKLNWQANPETAIFSEKDRELPSLAKYLKDLNAR